MRRSLLSVACVLLAGCSGTEARAAVQAERPDTLAVSSDPELQARVEQLLPSLAERAGLPLERPVRVEWRTRDELEAYLLAQLEEELPVDEADYMTRAYSLLGLVPETLDLRSLLVDVYQEQVAGFYDPDSLTLWIMDDQPEMTLQTVLLHELVHAVQDQATSLDEITSKDLGSDRRAAAQAAIEGHATLVMVEEMMERARGGPVDLTEIPGLANSLVPSPEDIQLQYPALAEAPAVIRESLLFPYLAGAGFVLELWRETGAKPAPFGASLPLSTEHILHPATFLDSPRDEPVSLVVASDHDALYDDELGELGTRIFLEEAAAGNTDASGWAGDRFALFESGAGDAVVWFVAWDTAADRDRFQATVTGTQWARRTGATIEAFDAEGHPAVRLVVGAPPQVQVRVAP